MLTVFIVCHLAVSDANARTRIVMASHESSDPYVFLSLRWDFPYPQHVVGSLTHTLSLNELRHCPREGACGENTSDCGGMRVVFTDHYYALENARGHARRHQLGECPHAVLTHNHRIEVTLFFLFLGTAAEFFR